MIRINLATKKRISSGGSAGANQLFSGLSKGKNIDVQFVRDIFSQFSQLDDAGTKTALSKLVSYLILGLIAWYGEAYYKDMQIQEIDALIHEQKTEKDSLNKRITALKKDEEEKKSLESDELLFKTKIEAINNLVAKRAAMMKVLVSLSEMIPNDVWLSEFEMKDSVITIRGFGMKFELISDFVQNLGRSDVFSDVTLKNTEVSKIESSSNESIPSFELYLKRKER